MKKRRIALLLLLVFLVSCAKKTRQFKYNPSSYDSTKEVVIAGKINNYDPEITLRIIVQKIGLGDEILSPQVDKDGNFKTSFTTYIPTDFWVDYKTSFLALAEPNDSIHILFDGKEGTEQSVLKTIEFSGDYVIENEQAAEFQKRYYSHPLLTNEEEFLKVAKESEEDDFLKYLTMRNEKRAVFFEQFIKEVTPRKKVKSWAETLLSSDFNAEVVWYPKDHLSENNLKGSEWSVSDSYYDNLLKNLPLTYDMLISSHAISSYINQFQYNYIFYKIPKDESNKRFITNGNLKASGKQQLDSIIVNGIIKHTPDELLKQLVLSDYIMQRFTVSEIDFFDKNKEEVLAIIKEPFLRKPIIKTYEETKKQISNPQISTAQSLITDEQIPNEDVLASILESNKGKLLYIDIWATWCQPCLSEFPKSKEVSAAFDNKEVTFAYVCINSEEKKWKTSIARFGLSGNHYLLNAEQSKGVIDDLNIQSIPFYLLIDEKGNIVDQGSHLKPYLAKERIKQLLEE